MTSFESVMPGSRPGTGVWLTKSEVNSVYYNAVAGEIGFGTEARAGLHARAVARLVAMQARRRGKRRIRILEIAANNLAFARTFLHELRLLVDHELAELDRIDYVAVEYARDSLEAALAREEEQEAYERILRPQAGRPAGTEGPELVALVVGSGLPAVNLALVHAEANEFVRRNDESFDFAILNELLDDLPCRAYYAGADGRVHEAVAYSRAEKAGWTIRVAAEEPGDETSLADLPPGRLTVRSPESVELVQGISRLLDPGGVLLLHDYGFAGGSIPVGVYEPPPTQVPSFVSMDFPAGSERGFPRGFFRVFGNEWHGVVQVTNDVNFAEIARALAGTGTVIVLPHGNAIVNRPGGPDLARGDGVFLSEFSFLEPSDDLAGLLAGLEASQAALRESYVRDRMDGRESVFLDLLYVKR
jgi:Putative S-adenosyl-L-methionine-dependent methyltransferase